MHLITIHLNIDHINNNYFANGKIKKLQAKEYFI